MNNRSIEPSTKTYRHLEDEYLISLVTNTLSSPNSKDVYRRALQDFLDYWRMEGKPLLSKMFVQEYIHYLLKRDTGRVSISIRLTTIRRLAEEAADNNLLPDHIVAGIHRIKYRSPKGKRVGNWLTLEEAQTLLDVPDTTTLKGKRDRAILAVLLGAGLRRAEAAGLTATHLKQREGRWVLVDLIGKGQRYRSIPIANWVHELVGNWMAAASLSSGHIFRAVNKADSISRSCISPKTINNVVQLYAEECGLEISAHDLRRTFAKLAHQAGAPIEQIQLSLGHSSIRTTELYLGIDQDIQVAPTDFIQLSIN